MIKKIVFTTATLIFSTAILLAQPKADFLKTTHHFGEIKEVDGSVETDFLVRNSGDKPLFFTEVKPSCGCTQPEWTKDSIAPGDTGFIRAKFSPANLSGPFEKLVYVRTNGQPSSMTLFFSGSIIPRPFTPEDKYPLEYGKLRVENNFAQFGQAYMGEIDTAHVKIYNQSKTDVYITSVFNTFPYINFEIPDLRVKPGEESILNILFDTKASGKYGENNYVFYLNTNDSPSTANIPIYAQIHVKEKFPKMSKKQLDKAPKIQVDAQMIYLGKVLRGDTIDFQYMVTNMGKEPLVIHNVNALCGCTASVIDKNKLKRGESTIVRARFYTEGRQGPQEKFITIVSNDPVTPEIRVGFTAEIVTNPNAVKY